MYIIQKHLQQVCFSPIGSAFKDLKYINPLKQLMDPSMDVVQELPFLEGDHVTADVGTGLVHTAPAHGQEDFQKGMQYGLPVVIFFFFLIQFVENCAFCSKDNIQLHF